MAASIAAGTIHGVLVGRLKVPRMIATLVPMYIAHEPLRSGGEMFLNQIGRLAVTSMRSEEINTPSSFLGFGSIR